jgi:hypothetical protein
MSRSCSLLIVLLAAGMLTVQLSALRPGPPYAVPLTLSIRCLSRR